MSTTAQTAGRVNLLAWAVLAISLTALAYLAISALGNANEYEQQTLVLVEHSRVSAKSSALMKQAGEFLSFGQYEGFSDFEHARDEAFVAARVAREASVRDLGIFLLLSLTTALFLALRCRLPQMAALCLLVTSILALVVGLSAPILTVLGFKDLPVLGEVMVLFQSKAISTTIISLWLAGNIVVSGALFLFSILIPAVKTVFLSVVAVRGAGRSKKLLGLVHQIGKWSMADVFIVSLLLTFFALNGDTARSEVSTRAELQIGLYFFLTYVIFSMLGSWMVGREGGKTDGTRAPGS